MTAKKQNMIFFNLCDYEFKKNNASQEQEHNYGNILNLFFMHLLLHIRHLAWQHMTNC